MDTSRTNAPRWFALAAAAITAACGAHSSLPTPPPAARRPAASPQVGARWVLDGGSNGWKWKLPLGQDTFLYVSDDGRRQLQRPNSPPVEAASLPGARILCATRDDAGRVGLLAGDGSVFVAESPLGVFKEPMPSPVALSSVVGGPIFESACGRGVMILTVLPKGGKALRSMDLGGTWKELDYAAGDRWLGHPGPVALDGKGNGLLVHLPQRVYRTKDDGETWAPLPSPGIGVTKLFVDAAGTLFLEGVRDDNGELQRAVLDGDLLRKSKDVPVPIVPERPNAGGEYRPRHSVLVDDREVSFTIEGGGAPEEMVWISSAKIGDPPPKPVRAPELRGVNGDGVAVHDREMAVTRPTDDGTSATLLRSTDFGATWRTDAELDGSVPLRSTDQLVNLAIGPQGWTYVAPLCPRGEWQQQQFPTASEANCGPAKLRVVGGDELVAAAPELDLVPRRVVFDESRDRVYFVGKRDDDKWAILGGTLRENAFAPVPIDLPGTDMPSVTVDRQGTLRVFVRDRERDTWVIRQWTWRGEALPALRVDLPEGDLAFAGQRGLLAASLDWTAAREEVWETADAGATWQRAVSPHNSASAEPRCSAAACRVHAGYRLGWDLPVGGRGAVSQYADSSPPAKSDATQATPSATKPAHPARRANPLARVTCSAVGTATALPTPPTFVDTGSDDTRWLALRGRAEGTLSVIVGGATSAREIALFAPSKVGVWPSKKPRGGANSFLNGDGVVAIRSRPSRIALADLTLDYARDTITDHAGDVVPRDEPASEVELAWWSTGAARAAHARIPAVLDPGEPRLVDGGVLLPTGAHAQPLFVRDGGATETLSLPSGGLDLANLERVQGRWLAIAGTYDNNVVLATSTDGRTWESKAWRFNWVSRASLRLLRGQAVLDVTLYKVNVVLPVDLPLRSDPPPALYRGFGDRDCDGAKPMASIGSFDMRTDERELEAVVDGDATAPLQELRRFVREAGDATLCTSRYLFGESSGSPTLLLDRKKATLGGWRALKPTSTRDTSARVMQPVSCAPSP